MGTNTIIIPDPAFDDRSSSLIRLNNGTILYLREVCNFLALVCILREDNFEKQSKSLNKNNLLVSIINLLLFFLYIEIIDYNFMILRKGIHKLFELKDKDVDQSSKCSSRNE